MGLPVGCSELLAFRRYMGSSGTWPPIFWIRECELWASATILLGTTGGNSSTSDSLTLPPVGFADANMSPSYSLIDSPSSCPK